MARILIVDDDQKFLDVISRLLVGRGYEVYTTDNGEMALQWLTEQPADLLLCDLNMSPMSGTAILKVVHEKHPDLAVVILTGYGTVETAIECLRMGAFDYMTKPFKVQELVETIDRALAWEPGRAPDEDPPDITYRLKDIVAQSAAMQDVCTMIERVAPTDVTVLFYGERGVGKQLAGRTIHAASARHEGPFVVADCAHATPRELARTLFGVAGDSSQPDAAPTGLFAQASGGTIWLSEIGALSLDIQERLLRVFKEQVIVPEGASNPIPVNVRVLAETAMNIEHAVGLGEFRGDLFARFAPIAIEIKPLRERREDIVPLLWHCLRRHMGADIALPPVDPDARGQLMHYGWPGNTREIDDVARHILKSGAPSRITAKLLPEGIMRALAGVSTSTLNMDGTGRAKSLKAFLSRETKIAAASARESMRTAAK
ncbi:MAG: sigma-54 dependent transcriptional regulator [Verrucomicrobia bacterium]|nr:sigma-54 dependent transcriptional regulator [Verrucomicrobiota bacterium]